MARYYYRFGRKPPTDYVNHLRQESVRLARVAMERLHLGPGSSTK
jgi:hypothetical protein